MHCRGYSLPCNARALSTSAQTIVNRRTIVVKSDLEEVAAAGEAACRSTKTIEPATAL